MIMDCRLQKTQTYLTMEFEVKNFLCCDGKDEASLPLSNSMGDAN